MSAQYAKDMASLANIIETSNGRNLAARTQARVHEEIVRKHVNEQTLRILVTVHREFLAAHGGKAPPTPTEQEAPNLRDEELEELKRGSEVVKELLRVVPPVPFSVRISPSSIPNAGNGVFLQGSAKAGDVVALFSGAVIWPEFFGDKDIRARLMDNKNTFLTARQDGILVDSNVDILTLSTLMQDRFERRDLALRPNRFAVAAFANHPPRDPNGVPRAIERRFDVSVPASNVSRVPALPANCVVTHWNPPMAIPSQLRPYIPCKLLRVSPIENAEEKITLVQSLVLVAARDLRNEELFVNYRLNPMRPYPEYYHPIDINEDIDRWLSK